MSTLRTGAPKIVRVTSPICRARPKWALSPSGEVPGISVESSITVPSTLPRFDPRIPPKPCRRSQPWGLSECGADDFRGRTKHGHGILVEVRIGAAVDGNDAQLSRQRRGV